MKTSIRPSVAAVAVASVLAIVASPLGAVQFTFSGYSYSVAPSGTYPDSGGELTDGDAIVPVWPNPAVDAEFGRLVGWQADPTITFTFASPVTVGSVTAFFADSDGSAGVALPASVTITDGGSFSQLFNVVDSPGSGLTIPLTFDGFSITTDTLTLSFVRSSSWGMLSEVQAFSAIPEPSAAAALAGFATLGVVALRRRRRA